MPEEAGRIDHADCARPAHLVAPQLGQVGLGALVGDRGGRHVARVARRSDGAAQVVVVGELVVQHLEPADLGQHMALEGHRSSEAGLGHVEPQAHDHVGQKLVVDAKRRQVRPNAAGRLAGIEASDEADARTMQPLHHMVQVVALHPDVAVGHDDDLIGDRARHVHQVGNLAVFPVNTAVHHQADVEVRIGPLQPADHRDGLVGVVMHPEDDLDRSGIILVAEAFQVLPQPVLNPVQGLQESDGGR